MKPRFALVGLVAVALVALAGCADTAAPPKPASLKAVSGDAQSGTVGQSLAAPPTFVVSDERGAPMTGVSVTITVLAGGGAITGSPAKTTGAATSVGTWRLGPKVGANQLKVAVEGLAPLTLTATAAAGAAAKMVPATPAAVSGRVAEVAQPAPSAFVTDAFDNPLASAAVTVSVVGGGSAPSTLTSDADGRVSVPAWTLGTTAGPQTLTLASGAATTTFTVTAAPGDPAQLVAISGDAQRVFAGTAPGQPIVLRVFDRFGNGVGGADASLAVTAGGGVAEPSIVRSAGDGTITVSSWTLGRSAVPQQLRVAVGAFTADFSAVVQTDYNVEVRFYGPPMTMEQRAVFTAAAARVNAIVTGDVPSATAVNLNVAEVCGLSGLPQLNETIDDLVIYASVRDIDGPRGILAQAGPCVIRSAALGYLTAVGVMEFDAADVALMTQQGTLQDVVTHEMLHVLGVGTLWSARSLVQAAGTPNVAYFGTEGTRGCVDTGGAGPCAVSVPVENIGGAGTVDSHWREATFRTELMTGYVNVGPMPLSRITVGSLADLGYVVNPFAADPFQVPPPSATLDAAPAGGVWERRLPAAAVLDEKGAVRIIRRP